MISISSFFQYKLPKFVFANLVAKGVSSLKAPCGQRPDLCPLVQCNAGTGTRKIHFIASKSHLHEKLHQMF